MRMVGAVCPTAIRTPNFTRPLGDTTSNDIHNRPRPQGHARNFAKQKRTLRAKVAVADMGRFLLVAHGENHRRAPGRCYACAEAGETICCWALRAAAGRRFAVNITQKLCQRSPVIRSCTEDYDVILVYACGARSLGVRHP